MGERMMVCPESKECDVYCCLHKMPHTKFNDCNHENTLCPVCVPITNCTPQDGIDMCSDGIVAYVDSGRSLYGSHNIQPPVEV